MSNVSLKNVRGFSKLFYDYLNEEQVLSSFFNDFPKYENFEKYVKEKNFDKEKREVLVQTIKAQYEQFNLTQNQKFNIEKLRNKNTFTVTTGHQLNFCTGPLYVIAKIVTTINLAKELKNRFPEFNFVPVYWMATEDHDFEEINHYVAGDEKIEWHTDQTGSVGFFETKNIESEKFLPFLPEFVSEAYRNAANLSEATKTIMQHLFADEGLICLDANVSLLKKCFANHIEKELFERKSEQIIKQTIQELENLSYKIQIHPRQINLFYAHHGVRERIVFENGVFKILNTDIFFSESAIKKEIETNPERFSPNVAFRPVYQEFILPNLAMIGGAAEVSYWLELKNSFQYFGVDFPFLVPRESITVVNKSTKTKMDKLKLDFDDLMLEEKLLKTKVLKEIGELPSLQSEINAIKLLANQFVEKAKKIDATLEPSAKAEWSKIEKSLNDLEKKMVKSYEKKNETILNQLVAIQNNLIPNGVLQERVQNYFYLNTQVEDLLEKINAKGQALAFQMNFIE